MSLKQRLEERLLRAWMHRSAFTRILLPFSWLYAFIFKIRNKKNSSHYIPHCPVIVIGNLTVGGTGKTMLVSHLATHFRTHGERVFIISRGYGRASKGMRSVERTSTAAEVGDEPLLLARVTGCPVIVAVRRVEALKEAERLGATIVLSDDGLQHAALHADITVCCMDALRGLGNGYVLPAGPLREPAKRLNRIDFIAIKNTDRDDAPLLQTEQRLISHIGVQASALMRMSLMIKGLVPLHVLHASPAILPLSLNEFKDKKVLVIAGIGHPEAFYKMLSPGKSWVLASFPDHHAFKAQDIHDEGYDAVIMTEKDAVKCLAFAKQHWYSCVTEIKMPDIFYSTLNQKIEQVRSSRGQ